MSEIDWSELGVSELPTGTVTLLLGDVEGSTRLWQSRPEEMTVAIARMNQTVTDAITARHGVRPVEQGEGDSFVAAFARASEAVACALDLQRAPLAPIALRIGVHTGEVQLRDDANYAGTTINRTARLRDLAHGGQTVLSAATGDLVADTLPEGCWLSDLGSHLLRDLPRPERVQQLCHPDLPTDFPPLRTTAGTAAHNLPAQLTSFVGRLPQLDEIRRILGDHRLVTLTGAGGAGKTRLAVQAATELAGRFGDGVRYVDLAPITDPDLVCVTAARALGLPDQPGRSTLDTILRFIGGRELLLVLDNCEHLLDAGAALITALLGACPALRLMATSREPTGVPGEVTFLVPSLSLADEAVELFTERARLARPQFGTTVDNAVDNAVDHAAAVAEICHRLDGMPLAIELAAARVRSLSVAEILDSLHDRFRLLTGGARVAVRRQQTLRASVDWSHALLTEPEQVLFRRLAVFLSGFDLDAARAVAGGAQVQRFQVLDQLNLLVDKSLVLAETTAGPTRYRMLETVRQYALEKLGESGEADAVRTRHRDHFTAMAALLDAPAGDDYEWHIERAERDFDNMRAAFGWSHEHADTGLALALASSLQPLWLSRGRIREGAAWFDAVLTPQVARDARLAPAVLARALADKAVLDLPLGVADGADRAQQALALARDIADPAVLARALAARGFTAAYRGEPAAEYFAEAIELARKFDDRRTLSPILAFQANAAIAAGDAIFARESAEEGRDLADALGDRFTSRHCRLCLGLAQLYLGELDTALAGFCALAAEANAAHDGMVEASGLAYQATVLAWQGDTAAARAAADAAVEGVPEFGAVTAAVAHLVSVHVALASGDAAAAAGAAAAAWDYGSVTPMQRATVLPYLALAALAGGDLDTARHRADDAVATAPGWAVRMTALTASARVAIAQGESGQAERDAHAALASRPDGVAHVGVSDTIECLAALAADRGSHREAARLFGAAAAIRGRMGSVRFKVWDAGFAASVTTLRDALGQDGFDAAWSEGAALSTEEAIGYARRGHGERRRGSTGWESLTPTERNVVALVGAGLANKDIAARLLISPRTVQTHLTHVYTKLGLTSRMQLAQEAAQHG